MNQTIKYVVNIIKLFADNHKQIRRCDFEFEDQLTNFSTKEEDFPILFISPVSRRMDATSVRSTTLRLHCFDLQTRDRSNVEDLISDTETILNDVLLYFSDESGATPITISNEPNIRPLNNRLLDSAVGSVVDIDFQVSTSTNCDIPFISGTPQVLNDGTIVTVNDYLTCSDLDSCSTITDIQNDITILDNKSYEVKKVNTSLSNYFVDETDMNKFLQVNTDSGTESVAFQPNAANDPINGIPYNVGDKIDIQFTGTATGLDLVFLNGSGFANQLTVLSNPAPLNPSSASLSFSGKYSVVTLVCTDINEWAVYGDFIQ